MDNSAKDVALAQLAREICAHENWWIFPSEPRVRGFMGSGPIFLVGDQPSTSDWPESNQNRRLFYDSLASVGLGNAHITDVYKRRGTPSALKKGLPDDFNEHLEIFREELRLLEPTHLVLMGALAHELVWGQLPEVRPLVRNVRHFASVNWCRSEMRETWREEYLAELRHATSERVV